MRKILNILSWIILSLIPVGLLIVITGLETFGLTVLAFGFLGIWVFGEIFYRKFYGKNENVDED